MTADSNLKTAKSQLQNFTNPIPVFTGLFVSPYKSLRVPCQSRARDCLRIFAHLYWESNLSLANLKNDVKSIGLRSSKIAKIQVSPHLQFSKVSWYIMRTSEKSVVESCEIFKNQPSIYVKLIKVGSEVRWNCQNHVPSHMKLMKVRCSGHVTLSKVGSQDMRN